MHFYSFFVQLRGALWDRVLAIFSGFFGYSSAFGHFGSFFNPRKINFLTILGQKSPRNSRVGKRARPTGGCQPLGFGHYTKEWSPIFVLKMDNAQKKKKKKKKPDTVPIRSLEKRSCTAKVRTSKSCTALKTLWTPLKKFYVVLTVLKL